MKCLSPSIILRSLVFVFGARDPISRAIRLWLWCWVSCLLLAAVGMSALHARRGNTTRAGGGRIPKTRTRNNYDANALRCG